MQLTPHLVGAVALAAALVAFVLQNTKDAPVNWLFFHVSAPLWIILLITVAAALAAGELVGVAIRRARRK